MEVPPFIFPDEGVFAGEGEYGGVGVEACVWACGGVCDGEVDLFGAAAVVGAAAVGEDCLWVWVFGLKV